jgi:hypothetical protein
MMGSMEWINLAVQDKRVVGFYGNELSDCINYRGFKTRRGITSCSGRTPICVVS